MHEDYPLTARRSAALPAAPSLSLLALATAALLLPGRQRPMLLRKRRRAPRWRSIASRRARRWTTASSCIAAAAVMQITALRDDVLRVRVGPEGDAAGGCLLGGAAGGAHGKGNRDGGE